jgi:hypothetical protein
MSKSILCENMTTLPYRKKLIFTVLTTPRFLSGLVELCDIALTVLLHSVQIFSINVHINMHNKITLHFGR